MHFVAPYDCQAPVEQTLNSLTLEQTELESLRSVITLEKQEALNALHNLKIFLNVDEYLSFEKLNGGDCNAPILIFKLKNLHKIPTGVLKHEPDTLWAEQRMRAMDEMRGDGFDQLPSIHKDTKGSYLVKLGATYFSSIAYLKPDSDQSSSIEQMFILASNFHAYSKRSSLTEALRSRALDSYTNDSSSCLNSELVKWKPAIFETEAWQICIKCTHYFTTESFFSIYNSLPTQLIHGDITPNNTIISQGKSFFIDLDKVRTDVRLLDFATFSGWSFLERYLTLTEEGKLFSCIQTCYGMLEEIEQEHFHTIVLFGRCGVLEWSLRELKQALYDKDVQKTQQFGNILNGTIREINEIYNRIPQIKEILKG